MRLGFGLYRHQLDDAHFAFARQLGATDLVVHYVDYFHQGDASTNARSDQPTGDLGGWGRAGNPDQLWTTDELIALRRRIEAHGLRLYALENFDPAHWHDVLLDGPRREQQIEGLKTIIRNIGSAGIPVMGYYFSVAGVFGRLKGRWARGGAECVGMDDNDISGPPIPDGVAWNMRYRDVLGPGTVGAVSHKQIWDRFTRFIREVSPVAESAGVRMAAHPDDPPLPMVRGTARLVHQPTMYDRLLDACPSRANALEYCLGTLTEMTERGENCGALYDALERHSRRGALAYVHFRNVRGVVPHYKETFVDDGDLDMARVLSILHRNRYDGVLIPDHTPLPSIGGWHAGMAYAMGYIKALIDRLKAGEAICADA